MSRSLLLICICVLVSLICMSMSISVSGADDCVVDQTALPLMKFNLNVNEQGRRDIKIEAVSSTLDRLEQIKTKIGVIAIMGMYRTGKSFLMNQLLGSTAQTGGGRSLFKVGHTVQPETEEVSMFILPPCAIKSGDVPADTTLLFLDTPGLWSTNRGNVFDSQLLAVMNLISSVILYNVDGVPNRDSFVQLSDAIQAAKAVSYFDENKSDDKTIDRPHLFWVLQKQELAMLDHSGKLQTVKQFIQEQLNEVDQSSPGDKGLAARFNTYFRGIDGHTLPHPVSNVEEFPLLDSKSDADFSAKYKQARISLRSKMYGVMTPKKLGADVVNGGMLAELIRQWTENVNIPVTAARENSAGVLLKHIEDKEVLKAITRYQDIMNALAFPVQDATLTQASIQATIKALENVREADMPNVVAAVKEKVALLYKDYVGKNEGNIRATLESISTRVLESFKKQVAELSFPSTQGRILGIVETAKQQWSNDIASIRSAAGAYIPDYEPKILTAIDDARKKMFSENLQSHAKIITDNFIKVNDGLLSRVPIDQSEVDASRNFAVAAWNAVASDMSQAETTELANHGSGVMGQIRTHSSNLNTLNLERSIKECTTKARILVDQALEAFSGWSHYQSATAFANELNKIETSPYCRGPGRNATQVTWNFHRVKADYAQTLNQHILVSHAFTLIAWALAVYAGISIPQLANANHWDPLTTGAWNQTLCKIYPILGAGLIYISRLLPDAVWSVHLNYLASIILFLAFALGAKITVKSWRRKTEARWD